MQAELVLDARAELGEGALWDPRTDRLLWVDITKSEGHEFDPRSGRDTAIDVGAHVGTVAPRARGGLVVALVDGFAAVDGSGRVTMLAEVEADRAENRMNDGKCDSAGRLWAGTMTYGAKPSGGSLYRLDADLTVHKMLEGVSISNGIGWSLDDRLMYYIDSLAHGLDVFDFNPRTGEIAGRRRLVDVPEEQGVPDGMTVDAQGYLWVAIYGAGRVQRYSPGGELDLIVEVPQASKVTSCAFGGPGLQELYITTARERLTDELGREQIRGGGLFKASAGVAGLPSRAFAG